MRYRCKYLTGMLHMNNKYLPLVSPYPISTSPPTEMMRRIAELEDEELEPISIANTPMEFAEITAETFFVNALQMSLADNLNNSAAYKACKKAMPLFSETPNLKQYRTRHPHFVQKDVDSEICQIGMFMHPGQVLFHGGVWPENNGTPQLGKKIILTKPFSTSLCAGVAGAHANTHTPKQLWVITVLPSIKTPSFVFNNAKNQFLHYELEVLFSSGVEIECTSVRKFQYYDILEVSIA